MQRRSTPNAPDNLEPYAEALRALVPSRETLLAEAKAQTARTGKAGSWDRYGLQLDAGGPLNAEGTLRARTVVSQTDNGSFIDYVRGWNQTVYGAVDYGFSPDLTVGLGVANQKGHSRPAMLGLPRYADGGNPDWGRSTYVGADWNRADNDQTSVFLDASYRLNDNWRLKAAGVYMSEHNGATYQALWDALPVNGSTDNTYIDWATDFTTHSKGLDLYLDGAFTGLGFEQTFLLGANYSRINTDDRWARAPTFGADSSNVDHHRPMPDIYSLATRTFGRGQFTEYQVEQKGFYTRWSIDLSEPLKLILGARTSWYAANLNNLLDKKYYQPAYNTIDYNNYYGDPRNVMFSVKYTPVF